MKSVEEVIDEQLKSYNALDLETFVSHYHPEIEAFDHQTGKLLFVGHQALRERYSVRFRTVDLHADIANRMVLGNKVIDFERIYGIKEGLVTEVVVTYLVEDAKIRKVWFLYP